MSNYVTAGIILIGDELLSGRTQDTNMGTIARWLAPLGVSVGEARIIADEADIITAAVKDFSARFDYVFTTGGIGPTHDDITADCIAAAFDMEIGEREDALDALRERYAEEDLNVARRRMARIPSEASLIKNPISQAPGFQTRNVFTLAGVPSIMKGMLADIERRIEGGQETYSRTIEAPNLGEGDAAQGLAQIAAEHESVSLGSYPFFNDALRGVNFVARGADEAELDVVESKLRAFVLSLSA